jgi:hypothetical protein
MQNSKGFISILALAFIGLALIATGGGAYAVYKVNELKKENERVTTALNDATSTTPVVDLDSVIENAVGTSTHTDIKTFLEDQKKQEAEKPIDQNVLVAKQPVQVTVPQTATQENYAFAVTQYYDSQLVLLTGWEKQSAILLDDINDYISTNEGQLSQAKKTLGSGDPLVGIYTADLTIAKKYQAIASFMEDNLKAFIAQTESFRQQSLTSFFTKELAIFEGETMDPVFSSSLDQYKQMTNDIDNGFTKHQEKVLAAISAYQKALKQSYADARETQDQIDTMIVEIKDTRTVPTYSNYQTPKYSPSYRTTNCQASLTGISCESYSLPF